MRIVLSNIGTLGDIHPLIAVALELKRRGHTPVMAVAPVYRARIEPLGLEFQPLRPDIDPTNTILAEMVYDVKRGTERGLREFLYPALRQTYDDLLRAVTASARADLLLLGELNYAGPLVAEVTGIPWASYVLAPFSFFSAYDPPVLAPYPGLAKAENLIPGMGHLVKHVARFATRTWAEPVYALRRELRLPWAGNPIFEGKHSPELVLAMFSRTLGGEQKDWPAHAQVTGFCFYDADAGNSKLPPQLEKFLGAGEPPVVFTLGSAAVLAAGSFYQVSAEAALRAGCRAVLLIGSDPRNRPAKPLPESICVAEYAPYSELFPRASLVVHHGGVGTTAQCLRAGRAMVIMPYSHDQPDNARRMRRKQLSRTVDRQAYQPAQTAQLLRELLADRRAAAQAAKAAAELRREDGVGRACDALEELHARPR